MQQGILITSYKNINHLNDIILSLDNGEYLFFIHIDKKSNLNIEDIRMLEKKSCVKFVSRQYKIGWGGINHLKAILLLLENAFQNYPELEYFHLITGQDFPVKTAEEISTVMEKNKGKEYMEYNKLPYSSWPEGGMDRLSRYNLYDLFDGKSACGEKIIKRFSKFQKKIGFKRRFKSGFPALYGGSTYWSLSRKCAEYIFDYMDRNPDYLPRFKYSFCAEEIFFQTIILNSPLKDNVVNNNLRYIVWEVRNGNFPANLDETDYAEIKKSGTLFARKFEFPVSANLLKMIKADVWP